MKAAFSVGVAVALIVVPILAEGGTKRTNPRAHSDLTVTQKNDKASAKMSTSTTTSSPHPTATPVKSAAKKTKISEGVLNGKAISKPGPAYPPIAKP